MERESQSSDYEPGLGLGRLEVASGLCARDDHTPFLHNLLIEDLVTGGEDEGLLGLLCGHGVCTLNGDCGLENFSE